MTSPQPFRSYSQNHEDVVINRVFHDLPVGHYVEVGAYHPVVKSTTYAMYLRGWSGVLVEPQREYCELSQLLRPRDTVVRAAVSDLPADSVPLYKVLGGARTTLDRRLAEGYSKYSLDKTRVETLDGILGQIQWAKSDIHVLILDVEGYEEKALQGLNLERIRPWMMIIESIDPLTLGDSSASWVEYLLRHEYVLCAFDGVSKYFLSREHIDLATRVYPACSTDEFLSDFPQVVQTPTSDAGHAMTPASMAREISSLTLRRLVDYLGVPVHSHVDLDTVAGSLLNDFSRLTTQSIDEMEQVALALQVAISRARLKKSIEATDPE